MSERYRLTIPYRDRKANLDKILPILEKYFNGTDYRIHVVEQNNSNLFNLGKLTNVGFDLFYKAEQSLNWTYIYQPVDCYPISVDYSIENYGIKGLKYPGNSWEKAFIYRPSEYIRINGYSNDMEGWGGEDQELRVKMNMFDVNYGAFEYQWDSSEDISGFNETTNLSNMSKAYSKTIEQFKESGYNTLEYEVWDSLIFTNNITYFRVNI